ncbi:MAG: LamG domain-containing protein [Planctomycetia bacterium]|nr:LamG domain-containing protein [Planctomycetia bacterium]
MKKILYGLLIFAVFTPTLRADILAHWNFNETTGNVSADTMGKYDATKSGSGTVNYGVEGAYNYNVSNNGNVTVVHSFGKAVEFTGVANTQLIYPHLDGIYDADSSVSFAFWVNPNEGYAGTGQIIGAWQNTWGYRIFMDGTSGNIQINLRDWDGVNTKTLAVVVPTGFASTDTSDTWAHVAFTFDRATSTLKGYLNGVERATATNASFGTLRDSTGTHSLGLKQDSAGSAASAFNGKVDEMYITNNALTLPQIRGLMYNGNMNAFVVANPYVPKENRILLGALFGVDASKTVQDAMDAGGTMNRQAEDGNLGVAKVLAGSSLNFTNVQDITGSGLQFDFNSIGAGVGFRSGVQNAQVNESPIRVSNEMLSETALVGGTQVTRGFKVDEGIGIHANGLITFNLDELREKSGWDADARIAFSCTAGLNDTGLGNSRQSFLVSNAAGEVIGSYVNGQYMAVTKNDAGVYSFTGTVPTRGRSYAVDFALPAEAKYLTLAATAADITSAHNVFAQAQLNLMPEEIRLNRLFDDTRGSGANSGTIYSAMETNTLGAASGTDKAGIVLVSGDLTQPMALATGASWTFDFTKNFRISGARDNNIPKNSICNENDDGNTGRTLNPLLGTLSAKNEYIGMHAESAITYDLGELREMGGWSDDQEFLFTATATGAHTETGAMMGVVLLGNGRGLLGGYVNGDYFDALYDETAGTWSLDIEGITLASFAGEQTFDFEVPIYGDVEYLTLALLSYNADKTNDHGVFLNPLLTAANLPKIPEPASWVLLLTGCFVVFRRKFFA